MKKIALVLAVAALSCGAVFAQQKSGVPPEQVDAAIKAAFPGAPEQFIPRLTPDQTMRECSATRNNPPKTMADAIQKREAANIEYPADGKFLGDWKAGERLAQSGY